MEFSLQTLMPLLRVHSRIFLFSSIAFFHSDCVRCMLGWCRGGVGELGWLGGLGALGGLVWVGLVGWLAWLARLACLAGVVGFGDLDGLG